MSATPQASQPGACRRLDRSDGPDLLAINRACTIVSDFTFRFDREPDFFAWPSQVFESFTYVGVRAGETIVGYGSLGRLTGWTGDEWGPWVYLGDLRVLPDHRGQRLGWHLTEALVETLPAEMTVGCFIVKKGNRTAEEIARKFRSRRFSYRSGGTFDVVNLPLLGAGRRQAADACRAACGSDVPDITDLLRRTAADRLFASRISEEGLAGLWRESGYDRVIVTERGGRLAGVIAWRDFSEVRRTTVLRYSRRSWPMRGLWGLARLRTPVVAALPGPGEALRALVTTHLAARDDDPGVLRTLVAAAMRAEAGRGTHVLQVGGMHGDPVLRAVRGMLRMHFSSEVWIASRPAHDATVERALRRPPCIDLTII